MQPPLLCLLFHDPPFPLQCGHHIWLLPNPCTPATIFERGAPLNESPSTVQKGEEEKVAGDKLPSLRDTTFDNCLACLCRRRCRPREGGTPRDTKILIPGVRCTKICPARHHQRRRILVRRTPGIPSLGTSRRTTFSRGVTMSATIYALIQERSSVIS